MYFESIGQLGNGTFGPGSQSGTLCIVRCITSGTKATLAPFKEGPERDLVNFPRPKRALNSEPVRLGFLPESWFTYFYPKTGVTGPYVFGAGLLTYLLSKEIWVLEHEFWGGVSFFIMIIYGVKKFGPQVSTWLEKEAQVRTKLVLKNSREIYLSYCISLESSVIFAFESNLFFPE